MFSDSLVYVHTTGATDDKRAYMQKVLASAVDGHADMLVTGGKDLVTVAGTSPIPIVDLRGCWDRLRA